MSALVLLVPLLVLGTFTAVAVVLIRTVMGGAERLMDKAAEHSARYDERRRKRKRKKPREQRDSVLDAIESDTKRNWTCSHCGKRNHANAIECRGCGADCDED